MSSITFQAIELAQILINQLELKNNQMLLPYGPTYQMLSLMSLAKEMMTKSCQAQLRMHLQRMASGPTYWMVDEMLNIRNLL